MKRTVPLTGAAGWVPLWKVEVLPGPGPVVGGFRGGSKGGPVGGHVAWGKSTGMMQTTSPFGRLQ